MSDLKTLLESQAGKELKGFLLKEYLDLKNIDNVKSCKNASDQALELKAQKKAVEKFKDILRKIIPINEIDDFDKEKDNYFNF
jgi:hypothetical protein